MWWFRGLSSFFSCSRFYRQLWDLMLSLIHTWKNWLTFTFWWPRTRVFYCHLWEVLTSSVSYICYSPFSLTRKNTSFFVTIQPFHREFSQWEGAKKIKHSSLRWCKISCPPPPMGLFRTWVWSGSSHTYSTFETIIFLNIQGIRLYLAKLPDYAGNYPQKAPLSLLPFHLAFLLFHSPLAMPLCLHLTCGHIQILSRALPMTL